jgi:hypothetical protein
VPCYVAVLGVVTVVTAGGVGTVGGPVARRGRDVEDETRVRGR